MIFLTKSSRASADTTSRSQAQADMKEMDLGMAISQQLKKSLPQSTQHYLIVYQKLHERQPIILPAVIPLVLKKRILLICRVVRMIEGENLERKTAWEDGGKKGLEPRYHETDHWNGDIVAIFTELSIPITAQSAGAAVNVDFEDPEKRLSLYDGTRGWE